MPDYVEPAEGNVCSGIWCFLAKNKQSGFTYLPSTMRGQEPSSLENRGQACC